jgi:hypothetical protein
VTFFLDGDILIPRRYEDVAVIQRNTRPPSLLFMAANARLGSPSYQVSATKCIVTLHHAEAAIKCADGRTCHATKLRRSLVNTASGIKQLP